MKKQFLPGTLVLRELIGPLCYCQCSMSVNPVVDAGGSVSVGQLHTASLTLPVPAARSFHI